MKLLPCPYLGGTIELTDERQQHILSKHPDFLPEYFDQPRVGARHAVPLQLMMTGSYQEIVMHPPTTRLFAHWFTDVKGGKFVVVAVVSDPPPQERHWIVTAYITRKLVQGAIEWKRS